MIYDIAEITRQMNALKDPTVAECVPLANLAKAIITKAWLLGEKHRLPGRNSRRDCMIRLTGYVLELYKSTKPNAPYPRAGYMRHWIIQARVEANAVEEGIRVPF